MSLLGVQFLKLKMLEMGTRCHIKEIWSTQAAIAIAELTFFLQMCFMKSLFDE